MREGPIYASDEHAPCGLSSSGRNARQRLQLDGRCSIGPRFHNHGGIGKCGDGIINDPEGWVHGPDNGIDGLCMASCKSIHPGPPPWPPAFNPRYPPRRKRVHSACANSRSANGRSSIR